MSLLCHSTNDSGFPSRFSCAGFFVSLLLILGSQALSAQDSSAHPPATPPDLVGSGHVVLQPGDLVRLKIWREPDLSADYQVDNQGQAVFPKIGPLPVSRMTADSLKQLLVSTYSVYLRNPAIEVTVLRRVNVLGAVKNPGLYQVDQTQTVADVVALAGGATSDGKMDKVQLVRQGQRVDLRLTSGTVLLGTPMQSGDQLWVPEKSWFSRNGAVLVGSGITAAAIIFAAFKP